MARRKRNKVRGPYVYEKLQKKIVALNKEGKIGHFKIRSNLSSFITPEMIGHVFLIYNGKSFFERLIVPDMVNYRIGMFVNTRKIGKHGKAGTS